jgi:hypothetical protein
MPLSDVMAGDEVIVEFNPRECDPGEDPWETAVVQAVTEDTVIVTCSDGELIDFRREDGRAYVEWGGGAYGWGEGEPHYPRLLRIANDGSGDVTPAEIEAHKAEIQEAGHREDLLCDIRDAYLDDLSTAALERIAAIIKGERGENAS